MSSESCLVFSSSLFNSLKADVRSATSSVFRPNMPPPPPVPMARPVSFGAIYSYIRLLDRSIQFLRSLNDSARISDKVQPANDRVSSSNWSSKFT